MHRSLIGLGMACLFLCLLGLGCGKKQASDQITIGFVVNRPDDTWYQNEWKFAQQAADKYGFKLVKVGALDGGETLRVIDNLAAMNAKGMIICAPDVRLGPTIVAKTSAAGIKLMSVDDQLVGADGKFLDVPHLGISASNIGKMVGEILAEQMKKRGWKPEETALCMVTWDELETGRLRTEGTAQALVDAGFPKERIFRAPQQNAADVPHAMDAANIMLTQHPDVKNWLVCSTNDNGVLGAIRAMEGRGLDKDHVIGVGINGTNAKDEFRRDTPTGFWGSILLAPRQHGFGTAEMMYQWIKDGKEPPKITYTNGFLITRDTYEKIMKEEGLLD